MRKALYLLVMITTLSSGLSAADELAYLGAGFVAGISPKNEINLVDNSKINVFLGWGSQLLPGLPLYVGLEGLVGFQNIGENSTVSTYYELQLKREGKFSFYTIGSATQTMTTTYWDMDLSPRATATLDLGLVTGSVFAGFNYNFIDMTWKFTDTGSGGSTQEGRETLSVSPIQAVSGVRVAVSFLYLEYIRYFDLIKGDYLTWEKIAENRISLGAVLKF